MITVALYPQDYYGTVYAQLPRAVNGFRLESFAQLYRDLATGPNNSTQEGMGRCLLGVILYGYVQVLKFVIPKLADDVLEEWDARVVGREVFKGLQLAGDGGVGNSVWLGKRKRVRTHHNVLR